VRTLLRLAIIALFGLASVALLFRLAAEKRAHDEAHRLVAEALGGGSSPEQRTALFNSARKVDPTYGVAPCEQGQELERQTRFKEAAASFQTCLDRDPKQSYALLGYARTLLLARGNESYVEVRKALRQFLELASEDPVVSRDIASRRSAEERILDLEDLLAGKDLDPGARRYSGEEIRRILLRPQVRGSSRYDGPRVPLRLGFQPGDASLSGAAEEQLREVARTLRDGSLAGARIRIEGHTDSVEGKTRRDRVKIATRRAEAVKRFFMQQGGIPADHLTIDALADDYPLKPNDTQEGCAANRRVELLNATTLDRVLRDVRDRSGS
jgi:outer membrane protein OmpA-like peptidoglycan-associated protein